MFKTLIFWKKFAWKHSFNETSIFCLRRFIGFRILIIYLFDKSPRWSIRFQFFLLFIILQSIIATFEMHSLIFWIWICRCELLFNCLLRLSLLTTFHREIIILKICFIKISSFQVYNFNLFHCLIIIFFLLKLFLLLNFFFVYVIWIRIRRITFFFDKLLNLLFFFNFSSFLSFFNTFQGFIEFQSVSIFH